MNTTEPSQAEVQAMVTSKFIEQLEQGIIPWNQRWQDASIPINLLTRRPFCGISAWLLAIPNYPQNLFLTGRQVQALRGKVKKGEQPHLSPYWQWFSSNVRGKLHKTVSLKFADSYGVTQCRGLPEHLFPPVNADRKPIAECAKIVAGMPNPPRIVHELGSPNYDEKHDCITMPIKTYYDCSEDYYAALFKHLIHATGHPSRLNRNEHKEVAGKPVLGSELLEEVIGQIGASYLKLHAGLKTEPELPYKPYVSSLLEILQGNSRYIIYACERAQVAAHYVLNIQRPDWKDPLDYFSIV